MLHHDLKSLRIFLAACELRSVSKAAESLNVALSARLPHADINVPRIAGCKPNNLTAPFDLTKINRKSDFRGSTVRKLQVKLSHRCRRGRFAMSGAGSQ